MKDDAERVAAAASDLADAVAQRDPVNAARALNRAVIDGKRDRIALSEGHDMRARLHAGALLGEYELATLEVSRRCREQARDLDRKNVRAVEILVQAVVVAG